jgi:hypothetical protein
VTGASSPPGDGDQIVGFFIEASSADVNDSVVLRACEVLSGFQGVGVYDTGQGKAVYRMSSR